MFVRFPAGGRLGGGRGSGGFDGLHSFCPRGCGCAWFGGRTSGGYAFPSVGLVRVVNRASVAFFEKSLQDAEDRNDYATDDGDYCD